MKRILAFVIAMVLAAGMVLPAAADINQAQFVATRSFLMKLESEGVDYTYEGYDAEKGCETVVVTFDDEELNSIVFNLFFYDVKNSVRVYAWNLVNVTVPKDVALNTVNTLNYDYMFTKFYLDETDSTITCEMQGFYEIPTDAGFAGYTVMRYMYELLDDADVAAKLLTLSK